MKEHRPEPEESWQDRQFDEQHSQVLDLFAVSGCATHTWDKEKGITVAGKPWVGIKSKIVRTCINCGKKEYWTNDGMFCGWFSIP